MEVKDKIKIKNKLIDINQETIDFLLTLCETSLKVKREDMISKDSVKGTKIRKSNKCYARHIFCYILYYEYSRTLSLVEIGKILGERDHATVINSIRKMHNMIVSEGEYFKDYLWISTEFDGYIQNNYIMCEGSNNTKEMLYGIHKKYQESESKLNVLKNYIEERIKAISKINTKDKDINMANNAASYTYEDLYKKFFKEEKK